MSLHPRRLPGALACLLVLAGPTAVARAAPVTARSFTQRAGTVREVAGTGGRQARVLALGNRARVRAVVVGRADRIALGLRLRGADCRRARATVLLDGRSAAVKPISRAWRTYELALRPGLARHSLGLRFRSPSGCRLLFDQAVLHPVGNRPAATKATATAAIAPVRTMPIALGAAVDWHQVSAMPGYGQLFLDNFAWVTPENEMKMDALQPKRGEFDFATADDMVAWAQARGKPVHGHTLVFGSQLPTWLANPSVVDRVTGRGKFDRADIEQIMRDHITTVMRHFAATVPEWDVVNEALTPDGSYKSNLWLDKIGPEYIEQAYRAARAAVPSARLCYNEIGDEIAGPEANAVYELVARLKSEGLIDCVGFEMHINGAGPPSEQALQENFARFAALGVEIHISEMDVDVSKIDGDDTTRFAAQARVFEDAAVACTRVVACTRFTTWGTTDAASWLGPTAQPLPFDRSLAPKPAWAAIQRGLAGR